MRRRLYFLLPTVDSARQIANDLLLARLGDRHMHFLARSGTDLGELHEATDLQKSDLVHGAELGLTIGAACGLVAGILVVFMPPEGVTLQMIAVLLFTLGGAAVGAWISSMVGAGMPNSRLKDFAQEIDKGRILLMIDTEFSRMGEIRAMVGHSHPEAESFGMEPTVPAFP